jgi:hypothetical protein
MLPHTPSDIDIRFGENGLEFSINSLPWQAVLSDSDKSIFVIHRNRSIYYCYSALEEPLIERQQEYMTEARLQEILYREARILAARTLKAYAASELLKNIVPEGGYKEKIPALTDQAERLQREVSVEFARLVHMLDDATTLQRLEDEGIADIAVTVASLEKVNSAVSRQKEHLRSIAALQRIAAEKLISAFKSSPAGGDTEPADRRNVTIRSEIEDITAGLVDTNPSHLKRGHIDSARARYKNLKLRINTSIDAGRLEHHTGEKAVEELSSYQEAVAVSLKMLALFENIIPFTESPAAVVINEREIPESQKAVLLALFDKESEYLKEFEKRLICKIRLLGQYDPQTDYSEKIILISSSPIEEKGLKNCLRIAIEPPILKKTGKPAEDYYLPLERTVVFAKALLVYKTGHADSFTVGEAAKRLYNLLTRRPFDEALLETFNRSGVFALRLPRPTEVDKKYYEARHKLSLAALIAA